MPERAQKYLLFVQNISREGPGRILDLLEPHRIPWQIVDLSRGDPLPPVSAVRTVIVLGGPDSANDSTPKIQQELAWIREVVSAGIPYLGICLGMQLLVKAVGGDVIRCSTPEIGWRDPEGRPYTVRLTQEGKRDPLFSGLPAELPIFHLHGETVVLPPEGVLLAEGRACRPQVIRVGQTAYGIQGHWELTQEMLERWLREDPDLQKLPLEEVRRDAQNLWNDYVFIGNRIFENFLRIAGWLPDS